MSVERTVEEIAEQEWLKNERLKLLSLEEIRSVPLEECGEPLVSLRGTGIYIYLFGNERTSGVDNEVFLRESIVRDLLEINKELNLLGLELMVTHGWREPKVQQRQFNIALENVRAEKPGLSEKDLEQEASIVSAAPDVAPHVAGAAVDVTLAYKDSHTPLDMGCAVNRDNDKMWRYTPFITQEQSKNRGILNDVFEKRGFFLYPGEYWHFTRGDKEAVATMKNSTKAIYGPIDRPSPSL